MTTRHLRATPAAQGLLSALESARDALREAPDEIDAVGVVGRLPPDATALPLLARAEALAREAQLGVRIRLVGGTYEIRFERGEKEET